MALVATVVADVEDVVFGPFNPFYTASKLPFGVPPFDRIEDADYKPALLAGMAEQTKEVMAIADSSAAPTFENTVEALEKTGTLLDRTEAAFGAIAGAFTNPAVEQLQSEMAPKMSAHDDAIYLHPKLFRRIEVLYEEREHLKLDPESEHLLEFYYKRFVHAGAKLNEADKARLTVLNAEESTLRDTFNRRLLAATKAGAFVTTDKSVLAGLSEAQIASAAAAAQARGVEGYAVPLQNTTQQPVLAQLSVRATRQAVFEHSLKRTERGDDADTRAIVARLAQLRAEKANLLGFNSYASWKLDNQMAKTPAAASSFMDALVPAAVARTHVEQKDIQELIDSQGGGFTVQPWDWEFYAEQVRKAKFDLDEAELRPYFSIDNVLINGVFHAATRLYGITFKERHDLPVYAPDVRVFEVLDTDGSHLAIFYADFWKRDNKRGGAWMSSFVRQSKLLGSQPVIHNVANFTPPADGQPALIAFADVMTLFHEFGHALHGMFSAVEYPALSGTSVPRDFVEFPSQFNEHWATYPEIFANYARHFKTGEAMPAELAAKLAKAATFNQGFHTTELLAAAEMDMEWHTLPAGLPEQATEEFERAALQRKGVAVDAVPPRYRSSYFAHVFGGGYAAGYYAYLWAEMLDYAARDWFEANGGLTRENGDRLRAMVLSRGNSEELKAMYERWLGGEPRIEPMLKARGLA